jgi:hypothetical protein
MDDLIHFEPISNGIDYLLDVVEKLGQGGTIAHRDLKLSILHLHASVEVLLKIRLEKEHWTLVVSKAEKTDRDKFVEGEFASATIEETIRRLKSVLEIEISKEEENIIKKLGAYRNKLQHWGAEISRDDIFITAAQTLHFLIPFIHEQLLPVISSEERERIDDDLDRIRTGLASIDHYVKERLNFLKSGVFAGSTSRVITCSYCLQFSIIVEEGASRCELCFRSWSTDELFSEYLGRIKGHWFASSKDLLLAEDSGECPLCEGTSFIYGVPTLEVPEGRNGFCFDCKSSPSHDFCLRCGRAFISRDAMTVCDYCFEEAVLRELGEMHVEPPFQKEIGRAAELVV